MTKKSSKNEQMKELEAAVDKKLDEMIAHQELEAPRCLRVKICYEL